MFLYCLCTFYSITRYYYFNNAIFSLYYKHTFNFLFVSYCLERGIHAVAEASLELTIQPRLATSPWQSSHLNLMSAGILV